jgi:hypothetical protein
VVVADGFAQWANGFEKSPRQRARGSKNCKDGPNLPFALCAHEYSKTVPAIAALSDSARPKIGIETRKSLPALNSGEMPRVSWPKTSSPRARPTRNRSSFALRALGAYQAIFAISSLSRLPRFSRVEKRGK